LLWHSLGVLVCGCAPSECHYKRGTNVATCKMGLLDTLMQQVNLPSKQVRFVQIGTQDRGRIHIEIEGMLANLAEMKEAL
jgi:coenzyme F420-reducing hydrogenase delta subunit